MARTRGRSDRLEIRNDRLERAFALKQRGTCMCIERSLHHVHECLYPALSRDAVKRPSRPDRDPRLEVGCVLRDSQTASHVSSLAASRTQLTRPLFFEGASQLQGRSSTQVGRQKGMDQSFQTTISATHSRERHCEFYNHQAWSVPDCVQDPQQVPSQSP
jgi:hypothetical protein